MNCQITELRFLTVYEIKVGIGGGRWESDL